MPHKLTPKEQEDHNNFQQMSPGDYMDWKESETNERIRYLDDYPEPLLFEPALWLFVICLGALAVVVIRHWP